MACGTGLNLTIRHPLPRTPSVRLHLVLSSRELHQLAILARRPKPSTRPTTAAITSRRRGYIPAVCRRGHIGILRIGRRSKLALRRAIVALGMLPLQRRGRKDRSSGSSDSNRGLRESLSVRSNLASRGHPVRRVRSQHRDIPTTSLCASHFRFQREDSRVIQRDSADNTVGSHRGAL